MLTTYRFQSAHHHPRVTDEKIVPVFGIKDLGVGVWPLKFMDLHHDWSLVQNKPVGDPIREAVVDEFLLVAVTDCKWADVSKSNPSLEDIDFNYSVCKNDWASRDMIRHCIVYASSSTRRHAGCTFRKWHCSNCQDCQITNLLPCPSCNGVTRELVGPEGPTGLTEHPVSWSSWRGAAVFEDEKTKKMAREEWDMQLWGRGKK
ncbi:hypothetical protein QBC35DRAFT_78644 [Podospora australis]|uniref:Uncharacterized protein n=1 Tax=Podospora australis TaxID=1536484 RepID=A0AAN6WPB3_9PEZI|nr:hypothetical protein QBC35DRAFT_78644 [Podospora australis]